MSEPPPRDPGLQPERTALAWQRTALSTSMIAVVLAFACLRGGFLLGTLVAAGVAVAAGVTLFATRRAALRHRRISPWTALVRIALLLGVLAVLAGVFTVFVIRR